MSFLTLAAELMGNGCYVSSMPFSSNSLFIRFIFKVWYLIFKVLQLKWFAKEVCKQKGFWNPLEFLHHDRIIQQKWNNFLYYEKQFQENCLFGFIDM